VVAGVSAWQKSVHPSGWVALTQRTAGSNLDGDVFLRWGSVPMVNPKDWIPGAAWFVQQYKPWAGIGAGSYVAGSGAYIYLGKEYGINICNVPPSAGHPSDLTAFVYLGDGADAKAWGDAYATCTVSIA